MTLPKRPPLSNPIPNSDIPNVPEQYIVKAPYWDAVVSGNLTVSEGGKLEIQGSTTPPLGEVEVQSEYWNMPLGNGLGVWRGEIRTVEPEFPPYGCRTDVITTGVTDFTDAWRYCSFTSFPGDIDTSSGVTFDYAWDGCQNLLSFPGLNLSSGESFMRSWAYSGLTRFPRIDFGSATYFNATWSGCYYLDSFPAINTSQITNFRYTWAYNYSLVSFPFLDTSSITNFLGPWYFCSGLTSFPPLDTSSGENFFQAWIGCSSLTEFPALDFSSGINFDSAWRVCTNLTTFPAGVFDNCLSTDFTEAWAGCALSQQSVDNILISIDTAGQNNGTLGISGGTSAAPGSIGLAAKASLESRGWTVTTN